ncbi:MAG: hypothetical protein V3V11_06650 [Vicinamibacteria bacterium]
MNRRILIGLILALAVPALLVAQSLTELAKEEKERRKKNKERGEQVQVITEKELTENTGTIANPDAQTTSTPATAAAKTREPSSKTSGDSTSEDDTSADDEVPEDVAADATIEVKLRTFEAMKAGYQKQVKKIDEEIQKNNQRVAEIQEELVSTGGTGLPTAPQADMTPRNPANIPALRSEQQQLRDKNQALEAQKKTLKDDLIQKGRRSGIPARYLQF